MYVPDVTSKEAIGSGRVICTMARKSGFGDDNAPRTPGMQKSPVTVARQ